MHKDRLGCWNGEDIRKKHVDPFGRAESADEGRGKKPRSGVTLNETQPSGRGVKRLTMAIDGPSGAGKSTVARSLAKRLGYVYIDTGAMYRSLVLRVKEKGILPENELTLSRLALSIHIHFVTGGGQTRVFCEGEDVTEAIRSPEISRLASSISKQKGVREALVQMQRKMGKEGGVVLEGRDIGTVVFPDADIKFYLDAESDETCSHPNEECRLDAPYCECFS